VLVASGDEHEPIMRFREVSGGNVPTSASSREVRDFLVLGTWLHAARWMKPPFVALQVPEVHRGIRVVSPAMIRAAHRLELDVHVWTVDDRATMERLLDWGVDGLMTDRPDILADVMAARYGARQ